MYGRYEAEGALNHYQCGCPLYVLLLLQHPREERHDIRSELVMNYCPIKTATLQQGGLPGITMKSWPEDLGACRDPVIRHQAD